MSSRTEQLSTIAIALAAIAIAGTYIWNSLRTVSEPVDQSKSPRAVGEWKALDSLSHTIFGRANAAAKLIVVSDLECPACRGYHAVLRELAERHHPNIEVKYASYALDYHPNALPAANILECVADAGQNVTKWVDVVMAEQQNLGVKSWSELSAAAGVLDSATTMQCAQRVTPHERFQTVKRVADRVPVDATPTLLINGSVYPALPMGASLDSIILEIVRQR